jgi:hypothetical protein
VDKETWMLKNSHGVDMSYEGCTCTGNDDNGYGSHIDDRCKNEAILAL